MDRTRKICCDSQGCDQELGNGVCDEGRNAIQANISERKTYSFERAVDAINLDGPIALFLTGNSAYPK